MKALLPPFFFGCLSVLLSGCTTIYFTRGPVGAAMQKSEWHHDAIFGLAEMSPVVNLQDRCQGGLMSAAKVEQTWEQGLISVVTGTLYSPWTVSYSCK